MNAPRPHIEPAELGRIFADRRAVWTRPEGYPTADINEWERNRIGTRPINLGNLLVVIGVLAAVPGIVLAIVSAFS